MSLSIDIDQVTAVLLADGWHPITDNTFEIDSYEYLHWGDQQCKDNDDPTIVHGGGRHGICPAGFRFKTAAGDYLSGPLTAILAVRHTAELCFNPTCGHIIDENAA